MVTPNLDDLVAKLRSGDTPALARVLSFIENRADLLPSLVEKLYPFTSKAYTIGVTGAPGVGKSTLVDCLASLLAQSGKKTAILAIDPSSPFTGGALLGDRIRMSRAVEQGVFIRSMASRGSLGGLAARAPEAIFALDAAGYDVIIVETVGVGQGEVEIVRTADTVVLVLVPGLGDSVQALKAGIIEIADVFAINKADYDGADRLEKELLTVLSLAPEGRAPEIVRTTASKGEGVEALARAVDRHRAFATETGRGQERRKSFLSAAFKGQLTEQLLTEVLAFAQSSGFLERAAAQLLERSGDPAGLARELVLEFKRSSGSPAE